MSIRIPCLPSPIPSIERSTLPLQTLTLTRPRLLPWSVILLITLSYVCFTSLAVGSNGIMHITRQIGAQIGSAKIVTATFNFEDWLNQDDIINSLGSRSDESTASTSISPSAGDIYRQQRRQHLASLQSERASRTPSNPNQQQQQQRHHASGIGFLSSWALIDVPPLSAEPLSILVAHEYASFAIFAIRNFIIRPIWHLALWWHLLCAIGTILMLLRFYYSRGEFGIRSFPIGLVHILCWSIQSCVFGWPSIFMLQLQMNAKSKHS